MEYGKDVLGKLKCHVVDSTALLAEAFPVFGAFEIGIAKMSVATSVNAKLVAGGLFYSGLGYLFAKGRDLSKRTFGVTDRTREVVQCVHDMAYTVAFNSVVSPSIYAVSQKLAGEDLNLESIAIGTATAIGVGVVNGGLAGIVWIFLEI